MGKDYTLLCNSCDFENIVDINILKHISSLSSMQRSIDVCLEVVKASECVNLSNTSEYLVQTAGRSYRVLSKTKLDTLQYLVDEAVDVVPTRNMWINMRFLTSQTMASRLGQIAYLKEIDVQGRQAKKLSLSAMHFCESEEVTTLAIQVPPSRVGKTGRLSWLWRLLNPSWSTRLRIRLVAIYLTAYFLYHCNMYWITAVLHGLFIPRDDRNISDVERSGRGSEEGELSLFWVENGIWLLLLILYTLILTKRRFKVAGLSKRPQDRERQAKVDCFQILLLGCSRFLYSGLKKTAEVRGWCGGDVWSYLWRLHGLAFAIEFVGSCVILWVYDEFSVIEPVEPS
ncbi:hypothetical protein ACQJBY_050088 [Aegilops geniculata]